MNIMKVKVKVVSHAFNISVADDTVKIQPVIDNLIQQLNYQEK